MSYPTPYRTKNSKNWYFNVTVNGKRRNLSTHCDLKREAKQYILDFIDSQSNQVAGYTGLTFREYSAPYYHWEICPKVARALNEGKPMGERHVAQCRRNLDKYVLQDPFFPNLEMMEIKRRDILDLRERLKLILVDKTNTLNKTISAVKAVIAEAYYREDIQTDPGSRIGLIKEDRQTRDVLNGDELKILFSDSPGFWDDQIGYDFFFVLANTGMRSAELRALKWDMWEKNSMIIKIHRSWKGNKGEILGLPKWDKTRDIPVSSQVADIINCQPHRGEFIFSHPSGEHLGYTWVNKRARAAVNRSGLTLDGRKITAHCLRHSCNTYLLAQGVNPVFVQAYLGWSKDSALTRVQEGYTHFLPEHIRDCPETMADIWEGEYIQENVIAFPGPGLNTKTNRIILEQ